MARTLFWSLTAAATVAAALAFSPGARAEFFFAATLTNDQENPPVVPTDRPASFGEATFVLNDAMTEFRYTATVFNIDFTGTQTPGITADNLTAAHIHAPGPPGVNAGVVFGFFGAPFNDNNPNDVVVTPFTTGVGGTISGKWDVPEGNGGTTLTAQLPNILAGNSYINFHTTQFGGGEVRGQILAVPEPSLLALLGLSTVVLIGYGRRRARAAA